MEGNANGQEGDSPKKLILHIPRKKLPPLPGADGASAQPSSVQTPYQTIPTNHQPPVEAAPEKRIRKRPTWQRESYEEEENSDSLEPPRKRRPSSGRSKKSSIKVKSEDPLVLIVKIKLPPPGRVREQRASKRRTYMEQDESDPDDYLTDEEQTRVAKSKNGATRQTTEAVPQEVLESGPPPGELATLWYSGEAFINVFVLDKICGWKSRPNLVLKNADTNEAFRLPKTEADGYQARALQDPTFWREHRMDVSRINPAACPVVQSMAAALSDKDGTGSKSQLKVEVIDESLGLPREEVLLVKWRGRSHWHCSWERPDDIINYQETDKNATVARNKIKRYYQAQEMALGTNWKQVLEEERATAAQIHSQGHLHGEADEDESEEFFPPQCLEVERILACDEAEMKMEVLYRQRALNLRDEQGQVDKEKDQLAAEVSSLSPVEKAAHLVKGLIKKEETMSWDPEDYVRYVVKWKALPYSEITWEYWKDIKQEAVDEAERFWLRQQPSQEFIARASQADKHRKTRPHIRDFRKLKESPAYGISACERLTIDLNTDEVVPLKDANEDSDTFKGFRLRNYQLEGVNWLLFNWWNKRSCILADEMGLGKTIQSAAFLIGLQSIPAASIDGPFLIVAPLSLVNQWQSELRTWAPDMNVVLYHGSADARDFLVRHDFFFREEFASKPTAIKLKKLHATKFNILITTYEVVLKDISVLSKIKWQALIVDEAHRLKNPKSRLFEELATLPREHCVLLTGTPIANATEELWALLHFANPSVFDNNDAFLSKFGEMTDVAQVTELHNLLKPYLLRRVKEDVEKSLPPKEETILEVALTPIQKKFYKAIYERNTSFLFKGSKPSNTPSLMNVMMELRKCCNHPFLVKGAEERILDEAAAKIQNGKLSGEDNTVDPSSLFEEQLIKSSGKMVLMDKLLQKLFSGGHKVLVFSQMVRVLDLLEQLLLAKKYKYERLDGSTSASSRLSAVDRFTRKSCQRFVMLLSTRAGGLGLNLTAADIVIIFDSDWNPQNDLQAMARAHRIGQTRAVRVYRLLTAKTYEMHMFHSASLKLGLERAVMSQNREQSEDAEEGKSKKVSDRQAQAKEIDELLKKGAYDVFRDDDDKDAEKFMESDIDQLLEHSSKQVTYGASATSSLGSGLGSFSKASFVADTGEGEKDVDLDDPDFWSKAVGFNAPEETPADIAAMLDDGAKRQRKQVQVFDPYAETAESEQRAAEKLALERQLEKLEKERVKAEKAGKKKEAKEKKKREKATEQDKLVGEGKTPEDLRPKKNSKKHDRQRALRRAELENPSIERFKQSWEVPQLNRATAAILRFGFCRFAKARSEANLMGLPLQDLELFTRCWIYQLTLQAAASILSKIELGWDPRKLRDLLTDSLGYSSSKEELDTLCKSLALAMQAYLDITGHRRIVRLPRILADTSYVADLRRGGALRGLRRLNVLSRFNKVMAGCLSKVLTALGSQELGKRGFVGRDLNTLDLDLQSRFVTSEELFVAVGSLFRIAGSELKPALWWDWKCDVGLLIGTFIHGLGSYDAMKSDSDLPFAFKIKKTTASSIACRTACETFRRATTAARRVFEDALEAGRIKAELEVQAAVAAAAKAAQKREADAEVLRKGGAEAEAVISTMEDTQVENAFEFDGTDSHFVTLPRLQKYIQLAMRSAEDLKSLDISENGNPDMARSSPTTEKSEEEKHQTRSAGYSQKLPMPDSRVLDERILLILQTIEEGCRNPSFDMEIKSKLEGWDVSESTLVALKIRGAVFRRFLGTNSTDLFSDRCGIGFDGNQCGTSHRSLNDGSSYAFGSASPQLAQVAYGTDAPRFLRAAGVPINMTRFAVAGLVHAQSDQAQKVLMAENTRFYGSGHVKVALDGFHSDAQSGADDMEGIEILSGTGLRETQTNQLFDDPLLRAAICCTVLFYGFPRVEDRPFAQIHPGVWQSLTLRLPGLPSEAPQLFSIESFRRIVSEIADGASVPAAADLAAYVEDVLLPHCLRLCVNGNGPVTRNARGSEGKYETAFGISLEADSVSPFPAPLPDPFFSPSSHSLESIGLATALLRRVRLSRACIQLCSGDNGQRISHISQSVAERYGLPIWWDEHVHNFSLLVSAASEGLFSLIPNRESHAAWGVTANVERLKAKFPKMANQGASAYFLRQAEQFPTLFSLERRLGELCAFERDSDHLYDHLPMFDHGGWPRG